MQRSQDFRITVTLTIHGEYELYCLGLLGIDNQLAGNGVNIIAKRRLASGMLALQRRFPHDS